MVTISPTRIKRLQWGGIRWKILLAFIVIVGVSFAVAASSMTGLISEYLYKQRTHEDSLSTEKLATSVAPLFQYARSAELNESLNISAGEMGGRLIVIDEDGKAQYDTFNRMCGMRLQVPEVLDILVGGKDSSYGIHHLASQTVQEMSGQNGAEYVAYCATRIIGTRGSLGVLLYVSPVQEMMDSLNNVELQLLRIFLLVALAAMILALFLSQIITKPITALSRTMRKMGKGDLSVRVPVKGSGELRELAENYNTMASQLESLDKSRSQFVSNASHELKTPLASMKILLESMLYQPDMPQELQQEFLQDMNHEIDRLTGIVTDLLALSQMDSHSVQLKKEEIDMSELTEETVRMLQPVAEKRSQVLRVIAEPDLHFRGDRSKLAQVLYNLTDNAIKYTPDEGEIRVALRMNGTDLIWEVADNGVGIPEEDQKHVFERFYRVDKARSRETGGTGLGLSIVRQLVHLHGGTVSVNSTPGQGTTFTVTLPAGKEEQE